MNVAFISDKDGGGTLGHYSSLINKFTSHHSDCIVNYNPYQFKVDYESRDSDNGKIGTICRYILTNADILVFNNGYESVDFAQRAFEWKFDVTQKNFFFYGDINYFEEKRKYNLKVPVLTTQYIIKNFFDTYVYEADKTIYIPIAIDTGSANYNNKIKYANKIGIVHAPASRQNKNTEGFLSVNSYVEMFFDSATFDIIENVSWKKSLSDKKKYQIGVDHINPNYGYYGISSLENSAIGLFNCVNLPIDEAIYLCSMVECDIMPWAFTSDEGALYEVVGAYIKSPESLFQDRVRTKKWFDESWDGKKIINKVMQAMEERCTI